MLGLPCHPAVETVVPSGPSLVSDGKERAREEGGGVGHGPQGLGTSMLPQGLKCVGPWFLWYYL